MVGLVGSTLDDHRCRRLLRLATSAASAGKS